MDDMSVVDVLTTQHRMEVTLAGGNSFAAHGREEKCDEQFQRFLDAAVAIAQAAAAQVRHEPKQLASSTLTPKSEDDEPVEKDPVEQIWDRAYMRRGDRLSLVTLPSTPSRNADAIILLLYGFHTLFSQEAVTCIDLMDAAKQSGLRIDRVDRNLPVAYKAYYNRGGTGKGMRYSLNNVGLRRAQEILEQMYDG